MPILTRDDLSRIAQVRAGTKGLTGILNESRKAPRTAYKTSVFLSHSHLDKDIVTQAVAFFRTLGVNVYVDWMDKTMPEETSGETATLIKSKILANDKFIFLATNTAIVSKWCNWEIGFGDSHKLAANKMAIFPLADSNHKWDGNEYLQIYPRIESGYTNSNEYWVWQPGGSGNVEQLSNWLAK